MRFSRLIVVAALALVAGCGGSHHSPPPSPPDMIGAPDMGPIAAPLTLTTTTLPDATTNVAYTTTLIAGGARAGGAKWSIIAGELPPGLALDSKIGPSVRLTGTPTTAGSYGFTVQLSDSAGEVTSGMLTLVVGDALAIDGTLPGATQGTAYSATLIARGGHGTVYNWTVASGALPAGLTLTAQAGTATISGMPEPGSASFAIRLGDDVVGETATRSFTMNVASTLVITEGSVPVAAQGQSFSLPLSVSGGLGSYHWVLSDNIPPGLTLGLTTGATNTVSGTLTSAGTFNFVVNVSDDNFGSTSLQVSLTVIAALQIATTHVANGQIGAPYSASLTATGGVSHAYQWAVSGGALPPGLTLSTASGDAPPATLSGTPTQIGSYSFTIAVSTTADDSSSLAFTMQIGNNPPTITTTALPGASWQTSYAASIAGTSAAGGPVTWQLVSGALPPGIVLGTSSTTTIALAGTPTLLGTYSFTLQMTDAGGSDEQQLSLTVGRRSGVEIVAAILPQARVGLPYTATVATRGASGSVTWSLAQGALPDGLTLAGSGTSAVAIIAGTPTTSGWVPFTLTAVDGAGSTDTLAFAIRVAPARLYAAAATTNTLAVREVQDRTPGIETEVSVVGPAGLAALDVGFSPAGDWVQYIIPQDPSVTSFWPFYTADLRGATLVSPLQPQLIDDLDSNAADAPFWSPNDVAAATVTSANNPTAGTQWSINGADFSGATPVTSKLSLGAIWRDSLPAWSPDGTRLAYVAANAEAIFIYSASGTITLPVPNGVFWASWNGNPWLPDSRGLVFESEVGSARNSQLFYIDAIDGAQPVPLSDPSVSLSLGFTSPDGGSLVLLSENDTIDPHGGSSIDLYAIDLSTRQLAPAVKINGGTQHEFFQVDWSPDSQRIALPISYGIEPPMVLARAQFGIAAPTSLPLGSLAQVVDNKDHLTWSADSQHLVIIDAKAHLTELALDGSAALTLGTDTVQAVWPVAASPRRYVYFANGIFGATLYYAAVDGSTVTPPQRLDAADASTTQVAVSPTFATVFYAAQSDAVYMVDLSGATPGSPAQLFPSTGTAPRIALGE